MQVRYVTVPLAAFRRLACAVDNIVAKGVSKKRITPLDLGQAHTALRSCQMEAVESIKKRVK